ALDHRRRMLSGELRPELAHAYLLALSEDIEPRLFRADKRALHFFRELAAPQQVAIAPELVARERVIVGQACGEEFRHDKDLVQHHMGRDQPCRYAREPEQLVLADHALEVTLLQVLLRF